MKGNEKGEKKRHYRQQKCKWKKTLGGKELGVLEEQKGAQGSKMSDDGQVVHDMHDAYRNDR